MKSQVGSLSRTVFALVLAAVIAIALVPVPQGQAYAESGLLTAGSSATTIAEEPAEEADEEPVVQYSGVSVAVRGKVSGVGWGDWQSAGDVIGDTTGAGLTAFEAKLTGVQGLTGSIYYRTYKRGVGWSSAARNGDPTITTRNVEAVRIRLSGEIAEQYDVLYRSYVSGVGWKSWARNYTPSGSIGKKARVLAIQVKLSPKTEEAIGRSLSRVGIRYNARVKATGWQTWKGDGTVVGKTSGSKALTGFAVNADAGSLTGGVKYRAYNKDVKWSDWVTDGAFAGVSSKRLEAIRIKLTGKLAKAYDVYYRAYTQEAGWLDWAMNGAVAGSTGFNLRLQAFQVKLVKKGAAAPGDTRYPTVNLMEKSKTLNGIDISSWQAGINIYAVDADFVIVKATEGTSYINPYFREWADQVLASGKQLGLYHFATDAASAKAQADFFYRTVKPYVGKAALFLDWENTSYSDVMSKGPSFAKAWMDRVRNRTGVKPLIYINQSTTWNYDWTSVASKYKLWLAQYMYAYENGYGYRDNLSHWAIGYWGAETIYQYSSTTTISGYDGHLDVNKFYGSVLSWKKLAHAS
ncbi:MAG: hypothetical protein IJ087_08950 [Eggerthellaceae bacterium]|nr:hypothetical protein [Eggerthellaceae bacterium]